MVMVPVKVLVEATFVVTQQALPHWAGKFGQVVGLVKRAGEHDDGDVVVGLLVFPALKQVRQEALHGLFKVQIAWKIFREPINTIQSFFVDLTGQVRTVVVEFPHFNAHLQRDKQRPYSNMKKNIFENQLNKPLIEQT